MDFKNVVCGLTELEAVKGYFMWNNDFGKEHTRSKLNRLFGNNKWVVRWLQIKPILLYGQFSDHATLWVKLVQIECGSQLFKFFNSWFKLEDFNEVF